MLTGDLEKRTIHIPDTTRHNNVIYIYICTYAYVLYAHHGGRQQRYPHDVAWLWTASLLLGSPMQPYDPNPCSFTELGNI